MVDRYQCARENRGMRVPPIARLIWMITVLLFAQPGSVLPATTAAPIRIVVFGDSGFERWVSPGELYPAQLNAMLRKKGYNVRVTDETGNGRTSTYALGSLRSAISSDTDIVIVQFGINDIRQGVAVDRVRANLGKVIEQLQQRGIRVLVVSYPVADVCNVAASRSVPCVRWDVPLDRKYYVPGDNGGFNVAGLQVMAARMVIPLEKLIAEVRMNSAKQR